MSRIHPLLGTAILLALVGCQPASTELTPPELRLGQTACEGCGMIVSDDHYAAALILQMPDGERHPLAFDDIGCMLDYQREHRDAAVLARFVKDVTSARWIPADKATYVRGASVKSPMASGIAAAAEPRDAARFAADHDAAVRTLSELSSAAPSAPAQAGAAQ